MAAMVGHMGPINPAMDHPGATFSQRVADRVFHETGVRATYRARTPWGPGNRLMLSGPVDRLQDAPDLIIRYGSKPES